MQLSATHLSAGAGRGRPPFHPRQLFADADLGFVQDPRVSGALFEESTGITPAASGRPNGLLLDSRFNLLLGVDRVTNGGFDNGTNNWAPFSGGVMSVSSGEMTVSNGAAATGRAMQGISTEINKTYEITSLARAGSSAPAAIIGWSNVGGSYGGGTLTTTSKTNVMLSLTFTATATTTFVGFGPSGGVIGQFAVFDNFSVRERLGSHAVQASPPSRPIFQTSPPRVVFDGMDDSHTTNFASSLGSACTVARAIPGTGAQILTGQTIGTSFTNTTTHAGMVIINRTLTSTETANLTGWLNKAAGL